MAVPTEDKVEALLCSVLPGDSQSAFGIEYLGIAAGGIPPLSWAALRFRYLGDTSGKPLLYAGLAGLALSYPYRSVRSRADLMARLVLTEEANPHLMGKLSVETIAEGFLLASRSLYYRRLHEPHLTLRARLDSWARQGIGRLAARLRG